MKKPFYIEPKNVLDGALATEPHNVLVITESVSGNIDVFSSDGNAREMMKLGRRHIDRLARG